jgi:F-type H+-transporting ATPase subunit c
MKLFNLLVLVVVATLIVAAPVLAQAPANAPAGTPATAPAGVLVGGAGLGAGLGLGLVIIGAGWGFGRIGAAALDGMARQPEVAGQIQTGMIVIAALLEGATFFALIVAILLRGSATF